MGLKCSVLGHAYGETTVERDREEQGSEVVITIREVETCDRCGNERVVSENKEVTSIETPDDELDATDEDADDGDADAGDADTGDADAAEASAAADADESDGDDAEAADAPAAGEELSASDIVGGDDDDAPAPPEGNEPDTGAEIIDAESDEPVEDAAVDEELADPTVDPDVDETGGDASADAGDAGDDADDAVIIDDETDADEEQPAGRQPGEWPEEPNKGDDEWKPDTIGSIGEDEEEEPATESKTLTVPDGQFSCPECGFTTPVESSSLRRGDFCPDCRRGTLVHEPEDGTRKE